MAYGLYLTYVVFAHFESLFVLLKRILDSAVLHVEVPNLDAFLCMSHLLLIVPPVSDLVNLSKLHFDDLVLFEAQLFRDGATLSEVPLRVVQVPLTLYDVT